MFNKKKDHQRQVKSMNIIKKKSFVKEEKVKIEEQCVLFNLNLEKTNKKLSKTFQIFNKKSIKKEISEIGKNVSCLWVRGTSNKEKDNFFGVFFKKEEEEKMTNKSFQIDNHQNTKIDRNFSKSFRQKNENLILNPDKKNSFFLSEDLQNKKISKKKSNFKIKINKFESDKNTTNENEENSYSLDLTKKNEENPYSLDLKNKNEQNSFNLLDSTVKKNKFSIFNNLKEKKIYIRKEFLKNFLLLFTNPKDFNILELQSYESKIVYYVLCRKMKKKVIIKKPKDIKFQNLESIIKEYTIKRSIKRLEECLKLVFKAFSNFKKNQLYGKQIFKKQNELSFYVYYFNAISCELNIHIKNFFDPSKNKKEKYKSFGKNYLLLLIKSEIFKKDFIYFLKYEFQNLYLQSIENKIRVMFLRLLNIFKKKKDSMIEKNLEINQHDLFENCIYEYFMKANQCKISWSMKEIQDSIYKTLGIIIKKF